MYLQSMFTALSPASFDVQPGCLFIKIWLLAKAINQSQAWYMKSHFSLFKANTVSHYIVGMRT